jgi:tripartite-type tricarboxylate transporter receptor subunit TctC
MSQFKLLLFVLMGMTSLNIQAQPYPNKPIKLIVGFAPGGAADYVARNISVPLGQALGQSIVIENKPGAGSRWIHHPYCQPE